MAQGVGADRLGDSRGAGGGADGALDDGFVKVVAAGLAALAFDVGSGGWKDPLPGPLSLG